MKDPIIIDNWLSKNLNNFLEKYFLYEVPHKWGQTSDVGDNNYFYISELNSEDSLNRYLLYELSTTLAKLNFKNLVLRRMYTNIQHPGMNGIFHKDNVDLTVIYMVTKTLKKGGEFQIKNGKKCSFIKNRLILFNGMDEHRGLAAKEDAVRISLAFKLTKKED